LRACQRGASLEFHVRNAERYADVLSRSKGVLMKAGLTDQGWGRYYNRRLRLFAAERDGS